MSDQSISLVIRGGRVFDSDSATFSKRDVAVSGGIIRNIAESIPTPPGAREIDAAGQIVAPGLVDIHVHAFKWIHPSGLDVDPLSTRTGVTTFLDAGSTGAINFEAFRRFVIEPARSRIYALLNVSEVGLMGMGPVDPIVRENDDLRWLKLGIAAKVVERNRDLIVGIKVRMYTGITSRAPVAVARELADAVELPLVVHVLAPPPPVREVFPFLKAGDMLTHSYHAGPGGMLDRQGRVRAEYRELRERGVFIDTGSAPGAFDLGLARAAFSQGFLPDTISTDITGRNITNPAAELPAQLNRFMAAGLSVEQALQRVTLAPVRTLLGGKPVGRLVAGAPADIAMFELEEGSFEYRDQQGNTASASVRLTSTLTIKDGQVLPRQELEA